MEFEIINSITSNQKQILLHTLELDWSRTSYRNYFFACCDHADYKDLEILRSLHLMDRRKDPFDETKECYIYHCTGNGSEVAKALKVELKELETILKENRYHA